MHPGSSSVLCAVSARRARLAEHGIGRGEESVVVVVAKATEEVPRCSLETIFRAAQRHSLAFTRRF